MKSMEAWLLPDWSGALVLGHLGGFPSSPYRTRRKTTNDTNYGKRIGIALKAIGALHVEVGQLFTDCDSLFRRYKSLYGNNGTRDLSRAIRGGPWMAEAVYRFWYREDVGHGVHTVPGLTAIFCSKEDPERLDQPVLVAGVVDYEPLGMDHEVHYDPWHLWHMWMTWIRGPSFDSVLNLAQPEEGVRHVRAIGVPLVYIESVDDVKKLFRKVGFGETE